MEGSEILNQEKQDVQDPYSFRCIPQVHGASKDMIDYVTTIFETEINSVTDNPTIFPDEDLIIVRLGERRDTSKNYRTNELYDYVNTALELIER